MKQRIPRRQWSAPRRPGHRPRVLVEDDQPALAVSDFSEFARAGFDVAFCSGPGPDPAACPLLRGEGCELLAGADAVLQGLDPALGLCAAIRRQHPDLPVLAKRRQLAGGRLEDVPAGCTPLLDTCSVRGQIDALERALAKRPR